MKILVIGAGYVGLVSAVCFAETGYQVICLDCDENKIDRLKRGEVPIYEIGLEEMLKRNLHEHRITFTTDYTKAAQCNLHFIAVDTPSQKDGSCDRSRIRSVLQSLAPHLPDQSIVVMKSTAPIGTCQWIRESLSERLKELNRNEIHFDVASNPEFLKEGTAVFDFLKPDRVVIGAESPQTHEVLRQLYAPFNFNRDRVICVDCRSSEMIKYASNAMLACRISFMNELAGLCERVGADIHKVRKGIGSDSRIGQSFLYAGAGWGGSCFPKDIRALRSLAQEQHYSTAILDAVEDVNQRQKHLLSYKVTEYFGGKLNNRTFAIWGLAFKPHTDDMREAPSLTVINDLTQRGARLKLYDPIAMKNAKEAIGKLLSSRQKKLISWAENEYDAALACDGIILMTEWPQFRRVEFAQIAPHLKERILFDGRNQYEAADLQEHQIRYVCIGRPQNL